MCKIKLLIFMFFVCTLFSCNIQTDDLKYFLNNEKTIEYKNTYVTDFCVYYGSGHAKIYTVCTENEVFVCSFNGSNYLFEKNKEEEIFSSTAPITIDNQYKYDKNGNKTEINPIYRKKY